MPRDIEQALATVIELEVEMFRRLQLAKQDLEARYDFTPLASFRSVDRYNIGRIDSVNLSTFLRANGYNPSEKSN